MSRQVGQTMRFSSNGASSPNGVKTLDSSTRSPSINKIPPSSPAGPRSKQVIGYSDVVQRVALELGFTPSSPLANRSPLHHHRHRSPPKVWDKSKPPIEHVTAVEVPKYQSILVKDAAMVAMNGPRSSPSGLALTPTRDHRRMSSDSASRPIPTLSLQHNPYDYTAVGNDVETGESLLIHHHDPHDAFVVSSNEFEVVSSSKTTILRRVGAATRGENGNDLLAADIPRSHQNISSSSDSIPTLQFSSPVTTTLPHRDESCVDITTATDRDITLHNSSTDPYRSVSGTWDPAWTAHTSSAASPQKPSAVRTNFSSKVSKVEAHSEVDLKPPATTGVTTSLHSSDPKKSIASTSSDLSSLREVWSEFCDLTKSEFTPLDLELVSCSTLRAIMVHYNIVDPHIGAQIEAQWALLQEPDAGQAPGALTNQMHSPPSLDARQSKSPFAAGHGRSSSSQPTRPVGSVPFIPVSSFDNQQQQQHHQRTASPSFFLHSSTSASRDRSPSGYSATRSTSFVQSTIAKDRRSPSAESHWSALHPRDMDLRLTAPPEASPRKLSAGRRTLLARESLCSSNPNETISPQPYDRPRGPRTGFLHAQQSYNVGNQRTVTDILPSTASRSPLRMESTPRDNLFGGVLATQTAAAENHRRLAKGVPPPHYIDRKQGIRTSGLRELSKPPL